MKMRLIYVNDDIIDKYKKVDYRVLNNTSTNSNYSRPYLGLLFYSDKNYLSWAIPLASPSTNRLSKHLEKSPFVFLLKDSRGIIGVLQINNMIPIKEKMYTPINFNKLDKSYKELLIKQMRLIRINSNEIFKRVNRTFKAYEKQPNKPQLCDFIKLANKCEMIYLEQQPTIKSTKEITLEK